MGFSELNPVSGVGQEGQVARAGLFQACHAGDLDIANDLWYCWTASASGPVSLSTCGLTDVDTKIAVYPGPGCPGGSALTCDDDACMNALGVEWKWTVSQSGAQPKFSLLPAGRVLS